MLTLPVFFSGPGIAGDRPSVSFTTVGESLHGVWGWRQDRRRKSRDVCVCVLESLPWKEGVSLVKTSLGVTSTRERSS